MSVSLHYREYGEQGTAIVLLHGLFGSSANWGSIARELSEGYRVIVPDLRNHGQSPHADGMSYPHMAADLWHLLDGFGIERPILVGHSMGGKVVMRAALDRPGRPAGIGVVDIAPVVYRHDFSGILDGLESIDLGGLTDRNEADRQLSVYVPEDGVRAFLLQNLQRGEGEWRWRANLSALRTNMLGITGFDVAEGAHYAGPTHFIHGTRSHYLQAMYQARILELFPDAMFCPVSDAGHWVYAEQREGFMECLWQLLGECRDSCHE